LLIPLELSSPSVNALGPAVFYGPTSDIVTIFSPMNSGNYSNQVNVTFFLQVDSIYGNGLGAVGLSVDNGTIISITDFSTITVSSPVQSPSNYLIQTTKIFSSLLLPNLSKGFHNVTLYYGFQEPYNPHFPSRYLVSAQDFVAFSIVDSNSTNVNTANSDIRAYIKPEISINSPLGNLTSNRKSFPLDFSVSFNRSSVSTGLSVYYSVDGLGNTTIFNNGVSLVNGSVITSSNHTISNLSEGVHTLTIRAKAYYLYIGSGANQYTIQLTVDTISPNITILSIENKTYSESSIHLNFQTSENTPWIAYNIDNHGNTTIQGNVTLSKLTNGSHSIIIYANDTAGNTGASETINFTILQPSSISTLTITTSAITIVVTVSVGLLLYRRHRKKANPNKAIS
jgi:hypothetical protein